MSPLYVALIECDETDNDDVVKVATPELRFDVPSVVPLSLNVTVPVAAEGATVAVNVTL